MTRTPRPVPRSAARMRQADPGQADPGQADPRQDWVLGVDSGGSGLRIALARRAVGEGRPRPAGTVASAEPVRTGPAGIDPAHMLEQLVPAARRLLDEAGGGRIRALCVGAAGMASLGDGLRAELPGALSAEFGTDPRHMALAADGVTAYAGALGQRPGAVIVAGTGLIVTGTDLRGWRRADGWGHLLGDCGGGTWIGRAGLEAAMRAYDGRSGGSAALRARAESVFGAPLSGLAGQLYPRTDRAAVLASFAPEVAACAAGTDRAGDGTGNSTDGAGGAAGAGGDPVAQAILRGAAREMAVSAAAVCPAGPGAVVARAGGLFRLGAPLLDPLTAELAALLPDAHTTAAAGDPLDGALLVADRLAAGKLALPADPTMLFLG